MADGSGETLISLVGGDDSELYVWGGSTGELVGVVVFMQWRKLLSFDCPLCLPCRTVTIPASSSVVMSPTTNRPNVFHVKVFENTLGLLTCVTKMISRLLHDNHKQQTTTTGDERHPQRRRGNEWALDGGVGA